MKKPMIALTSATMPMEEPFAGSYVYSNSFNFDSITRAGGLPILSDCRTARDAEDLMARCDGLFLTGGKDVCPSLYHEEMLPACGETDPLRDQTDCLLLAAALKLHRPVLCVCRGFQIANAYLGGTLYQDLAVQHPSEICHRVRDDLGYTRPAHQVTLVEGSPLHTLLGRDTLGVNTLHHQAVKDLAPGLAPMAYAPDGILESWYMTDPSQWVRAYQWHPEMLDGQPNPLLTDFISACRAD